MAARCVSRSASRSAAPMRPTGRSGAASISSALSRVAIAIPPESFSVNRTRYLGGSDVGFEVPGLGVFYGSNLTLDEETGLGNWTIEQIATAITSGRTPDNRILAPVMPVAAFKNLTEADALAIAAYLKTLPPIKNKVPGPFGLTKKPTSFVFQVLPPDKYVPTPYPAGK